MESNRQVANKPFLILSYLAFVYSDFLKTDDGVLPDPLHDLRDGWVCESKCCGMWPTGVDRWGTGGTRPPTFQLGGDHIGNVPPHFFA